MANFKNNAVKSMVVMRKAFRTIDARVSESFKVDHLTPTQFGVLDVLLCQRTDENRRTTRQYVGNFWQYDGCHQKYGEKKVGWHVPLALTINEPI